jgi:hypothetical protein
MNGISGKIRLAVCVVVLAGCRNTQYPTWTPSGVSQSQVNRSFAYHDPNPDIEAGPWIERPRGFERARAVPERVDERARITNDLMQRDGAPASNNPSVSRYPGSVNP